MVKDKYSAVWVSHTSITDFLRCPRSYYLKNIYRDPKTNHKIKIVSPPLTLGQVVHEALEMISQKPVETRFQESPVSLLDRVWKKVSGRSGGFINQDTELQYKNRAKEMLNRLRENPGPLARLAVKINSDLPYYWLSEKNNIILCGKIDWLEYLPATESIHIIDFKTSRHEEDPNSQQLLIYYLLVTHCQKRPVSRVSYWYLQKSLGPQEQSLPEIDYATEKLLEIAQKIKLARQLGYFKCPQDGCPYCQSYELILQGRAQRVGQSAYNEDLYLLEHASTQAEDNSIIH